MTMTRVTRARIGLHGAQLTVVIGLVGIVSNAITRHPWWLVMLWAILNGLVVGAGLSVWRRPYRFALVVRWHRIEIDLRTGLWCDVCALPSVIESRGTELTKHGVTPLSSVLICTRCNLTTTRSITEGEQDG